MKNALFYIVIGFLAGMLFVYYVYLVTQPCVIRSIPDDIFIAGQSASCE